MFGKKKKPEEIPSTVQQTIPSNVNLETLDKVFLQTLVSRMNDCNWTPDEINEIITTVAKDNPIGQKGAYKALYKILIGKTAGPRLGPFLASMDKKFVINRLIQASQRTGSKCLSSTFGRICTRSCASWECCSRQRSS